MPIAPEYLHLVYPQLLPVQVLMYGRNSRDPKKKGRSVADQLRVGHELCDTHGWSVAQVFKDTGISASRHSKKRRDEFEALLEAIEERKGSIVVAFEASRYARDLEAYVRLRNACEAAGVLLCYNGTVYDLSKREDRRATAQDALQAEDEAEGIRDRNLRTVRLNAQAGGPHGKLVFGYARRYDPDTGELLGQFPHQTHGEYAFEAFERADSGESTYTLAKWLKSSKEAARPDGAEWTEKLVKAMLLNPSYLGDRVYRGKVIGKAKWPALPGFADPSDPEGKATPEARALFARVTKRLTDPERRTQKDSQVAHLLSRIALCGECGDHALMTAGKRNHGKQYINCRFAYDTALDEERFDAFVEEAVLTWLNSPAAREAFFPAEDAEARKVEQAQTALSNMQAQLDEARKLASTFDEDGRPMLPVASLAQLERQLLPLVEKKRLVIDEASGVPPTVRRLILSPDAERVWYGAAEADGLPAEPGLTLEQRREVLRSIVTIRLYKASRKGMRHLEPGRIGLSFVGQPGFLDRPVSAREMAEQRRRGVSDQREAARLAVLARAGQEG